MSVKDVIKNSVLESFTNPLTVNALPTMALALAMALLFGLIICLIYNKFYRGVVYNRSFAITLIGMTVLTCMVTLAISSNIVISLGMVGALSIVRYRTAIKEPLDLVYLFWAITTGITAGAQMYLLAIAGSVFMIIILGIFSGTHSRGHVYICVVHYTDELALNGIRKVMSSVKYRVKSKTTRGSLSEIAMEVYASNKSLAFSDKLQALDGVEDVTTIQYDGEYHA